MYVGYGVSVRNTEKNTVKADNTIARQELMSLGSFIKEIHIDVVRSVDAERPELDALIEKLTEKDVIVMYSISALFKGQKNRGVEYYSKIIDKGIGLMIFDFSGSVARVSRYATCLLNMKYPVDKKKLIEQLEAELKIDNGKKLSCDNGKKIREGLMLEMHWGDGSPLYETFKDIYFLYEAYRIPFKFAETLWNAYCGIKTKTTFWRLAAHYEKQVQYAGDLDERNMIFYGDMQELPKRCGSVPEEYYEINEYIKHPTHIQPSNQTVDFALEQWNRLPLHERVAKAMKELRLISSYTAYQRWDLLAKGEPKPRRVMLGFVCEEFEKEHSFFSEDTKVNLAEAWEEATKYLK